MSILRRRRRPRQRRDAGGRDEAAVPQVERAERLAALRDGTAHGVIRACPAQHERVQARHAARRQRRHDAGRAQPPAADQAELLQRPGAASQQLWQPGARPQPCAAPKEQAAQGEEAAKAGKTATGGILWVNPSETFVKLEGRANKGGVLSGALNYLSGGGGADNSQDGFRTWWVSESGVIDQFVARTFA